MAIVKLLSVQKVAENLEVKEETLQAWLRDGQIPGIKMGRLWRINKSDLRKWVDNGGIAAHPPKSFNNDPAKKTGEENTAQALVPCENCGEDVGHCSGCGVAINPKSMNDDGCPNIMPLTAIEIKGQTMPMRNVRMPMAWSTRFEQVLRYFPEFCGQQNAVVRDAVYWRLRQLEDAMKRDEAEPSGKVWDRNIRTQSAFRRNQQMLETTIETVDMMLAVGNAEIIQQWVSEVYSDINRLEEPWCELALQQILRAETGIKKILRDKPPALNQKLLKSILEGSDGTLEGRGQAKHRLSPGKVMPRGDDEGFGEGADD